MLKRPVWKWPITSYFFLGGLSAGAYALGRAAHRAGGEKYRDLSRAASYLALATILPCPPLLIADLGDRKRFHHMLRVWKPSSPMNLGAWAITAFGGVATLEAAGQYLAQRKPPNRRARPGPSPNLFNGGAHLLLDVAGATSSIAVAGYTGVLLSCTANPLWCKNPFLGPLFSASAVSTGAEAVSLALDCTSRPGRQESPSHAILRKVDTLAHVAELGLMTGFLRFAGEKAKTLRSGPMSKYHHLSIGGILAAEVLKLLPAPRRLRRPLRMLASLLGLTAGFSMRWAMVFGGHDAAADPHTSRLVSRPQNSASRIGGRISDASGRVEHPTP
jgi:formate-dependent nitrite reductase membrane component NrfD